MFCETMHCLRAGITSIVAQFVEVDQYRWPGWFLFALGILYSVTFLLVYREDEKVQRKIHENGVKSVTETQWRGQIMTICHTFRCGSLLAVSFIRACMRCMPTVVIGFYSYIILWKSGPCTVCVLV